MIIFLYGEGSYRISQKLNELVNGYRTKNPSGLNFTSLDFSDNSLGDLTDNLTNSSLMPEKKLIILKNVEKTDSEKLLELIKSQNISKREDIILVALSFGSFKNKLFDYLIKKPNKSQNFKPLSYYEIKNWARKLFNSFDTEITGEAIDFLLLNCGSNEWRLDSEIRKIASYKVQGIVTVSQVEELVAPGRDYNIFELTDALAKKNKKKALSALHRALNSGEKPTELLGMIGWQVRNLLRFKSSPNAKPSDLKLHPFVLEKLKNSAKFFSVDELNKIMSKIINLDLAFKTSDLDEKTALSLLISEL